MTSATMSVSEGSAAPVAGVPFTVASRPQSRFSNEQTVSVLNGTSLAPIQLPATGIVRKVSIFFSLTGACASAGAVVAGDGPFNLISGVTLTDATGQAIQQPVSGYNLYLLNKYLPLPTHSLADAVYSNPQLGPEFAFSATATSFTAAFRLDIDLEVDAFTGYGSIPNLDSNASLQLKIDLAPYTVAFTGTTVSAANATVRIEQHYWAPVGSTMGGVPVKTTPPGFGDYIETRYETQTVTASAENTVQVNSRGGMVQGLLVVSRAAGVRTAFTAASNVGVLYDNNAVHEGISLNSWLDKTRRQRGYFGAELSTSYAPLSAGLVPGLDRGVLPIDFGAEQPSVRDSWLSTRVGTLLQLKLSPGASASQLEIITRLMQVRDASAFYSRG